MNLDAGLERCMGDETFYVSLLSEFIRSFRDSSDKLEELMDKADWKKAKLLAHSLKGTAGMLSATHVAAAASALDADLKAACNTNVPPDTIRERLHGVRQSMAQLMDTLNKLKIPE